MRASVLRPSLFSLVVCVGKDNKNCATLTKVMAGIIRADVNYSFSDLLVPTSNYCRRPSRFYDEKESNE